MAEFSIDPRVRLDPPDIARLRENGHTVYVCIGYAFFSTAATGPLLVHRWLLRDELPGEGQPRLLVDHINGDRLDNRRSNLRIVTDQINQLNRKRLNRNNRSGYRGVCRLSRYGAAKPWRASLTVAHRQVHLGVFATAEEAAAARRAAELLHYPEMCPDPALDSAQ